MKKSLIVLFLAGSVAVGAQTPPAASVPPKAGMEAPSVDSLSGVSEIRFSDPHMGHQGQWEREHRLPAAPQLKLKVYPWESETSVVQVRNRLPEHIDVPSNTPRRIATSLWISNGQAWNWGAYPDAFLDARTISVPLLR